MPLTTHAGAGDPSMWSGPETISLLSLESGGWPARRAMHFMILGGVFERHPGLTLVLTEQPGDWWTSSVNDIDSTYLSTIHTPGYKEQTPRLPSEYARDHVFIGASFHARFEAEDALANGYADRVIWGSDYPHFEGTYQHGATGPNGEPMTWASLRFHYAGLPPDLVRSFLSGNAMRAYDLDYDALTKVAARINAPTYDDLNSAKVEERPPESGHLAFRSFGFWA
jgi:predicted TIM-barrel fold metal-dependent hydrolase